MPSYSQEQITPVADARLVDKIKFSAKVALLKQQPNAPQGDERQDFKTAVYLCACLNNFSFEDALTSSNSSILSFMMTTFYQGFKGEGAPVKSIQDYMDVLQELVNDGALEHLGPGLGFVCPSFKIEATGKISAHFMTNDYGTELHFENGVYNTLVFSKYVLIPGDEVKVVINGLTNIATVIEITKMRTMLVGEYGRKKPSSYKFDYEAPRFLIHERGFETMKFEFTKDSLPHQAGNLLVVEIVKRNSNSKLTVRVREIVKDLGSLQTYIVRAVLEHSIPNAWPAAIANNVSKIPQEVTAAEIKGREDLRQLPLVTIDGDDAKDFDDAVYCEKQGSKFHLYVAIADVSYYVRKNTALDSEAMVRCNSVYFPYYVIPMLPVELSNGICSLNPNVDRLCMICDMVISKQGKIEKYQFYPAVMNSHARLTYSEAHYMLESGKALFPEHEQCVPWVKTLHELYLVLKQAREQRGAFEFEGTEVNFIFDEKWKVIGLEPETRNDAHMLIEECMIAANICAATFVRENKYDTLYRVHARPSEMKLDKLRSILSRYGIDLHGQNEPSPQDFKRVSQEVAKLDEGVRNVIGLQLLRSMSKATYHPENIGHFGLALENYAHFTSPIRRYPDLQLHRVIKFILEKQKKRTWGDIGAQAYSKEALLTLGLACTDHEVSADDAEFDVDNSLKCEYVKNFIGAVVPATVSTVASNAVFVTLNDFYIDGRLDWVDFTDADQQYFEIYNKKIHVGDQILVRIMNVNPEMRHIELSFSNGARAKDLNMADSVSAKLKTRKPLPPDSAYNNSYKDELFQRISDFSRGKSPNDDSMAVRNLADFGLAQKLSPAEGAQPASKKQSKMSQQMSEIKQQLLGSLQSAKNTDNTSQSEDAVEDIPDNSNPDTAQSSAYNTAQDTAHNSSESANTALTKSSAKAQAKSSQTKSAKAKTKAEATAEESEVKEAAKAKKNGTKSKDAAKQNAAKDQNVAQATDSAQDSVQQQSSKGADLNQSKEAAIKSSTSAKRKTTKVADTESDTTAVKSGKSSKKKSSTAEQADLDKATAQVVKSTAQGTKEQESADVAHKSTTTKVKSESGKAKSRNNADSSAQSKSDEAAKAVKSKSGKNKTDKSAAQVEKAEKSDKSGKSAKTKSIQSEQSTKTKANQAELSATSLESVATTASKSGKESVPLVEATDPLSLLESSEFNESKSPVKIDVSDQINRKVTMQVKDQLSHTVAQTGNQLHISDSDIASFVERAPFGTQVSQNTKSTQTAQSEVLPTLVKVKRKGQAANKTVLNGTALSSQTAQDAQAASTVQTASDVQTTSTDQAVSSTQTVQTNAQKTETEHPATQVASSGKTKAKAKTKAQDDATGGNDKAKAKDATAKAKDKAKVKDQPKAKNTSSTVKEQSKAKDVANSGKDNDLAQTSKDQSSAKTLAVKSETVKGKSAKVKSTQSETASEHTSVVKTTKSASVNSEQTQDAEQFKSLNSLVAALAEDAPTLVEVPGAEAKAAKAAERAKNRAAKAKSTATKAKSTKTVGKTNDSLDVVQDEASADTQAVTQVASKSKVKAGGKATSNAKTTTSAKSGAKTTKTVSKVTAKAETQVKSDDKVVDIPAQKTKSTKSTATQTVVTSGKTAKPQPAAQGEVAAKSVDEVGAKAKVAKTKTDSAKPAAQAKDATTKSKVASAKTKVESVKPATKTKSAKTKSDSAKTEDKAKAESSKTNAATVESMHAESTSTKSVPAKAAAKAKTKSESAKPVAKTKSDTVAKQAAESVSDHAEAKGKSETRAKAETKTKAETKGKSAATVKATAQADVAALAKAKTKSGTKAETKAVDTKSTAKQQSTKSAVSASAQEADNNASVVKKAASTVKKAAAKTTAKVSAKTDTNATAKTSANTTAKTSANTVSGAEAGADVKAKDAADASAKTKAQPSAKAKSAVKAKAKASTAKSSETKASGTKAATKTKSTKTAENAKK